MRSFVYLRTIDSIVIFCVTSLDLFQKISKPKKKNEKKNFGEKKQQSKKATVEKHISKNNQGWKYSAVEIISGGNTQQLK